MSEMVFVGGRVLVGDCRVVLADVPDGSVDSCVTDPPYDLTNRTPDVKGCEDCGRTLGGRDGNPEVCPKCGGVLSMQRSVQGKGGGGFMGHGWDSTGVAFDVGTWAEVLRVLKPGGHVVAFGATRSYHRMVVAIEDVGFEIRDTIMAWGYGTGFPKSHNVSKAIDKAAGAKREIIGKSARHVSGKPEQRTEGLNGSSTFQETVGMGANLTAPATDAARQWFGYGTALKPALEPITVARKPLVGTVAANVLAFGTGAINVDACRIEHTPGDEGEWGAKNTGNTRGVYGAFADEAGLPGSTRNPAGRWPANLIHDGSEEVLAGFPETNGSSPGSFQREKTSRGLNGGGFGQERAEMRERTELEKPGYPGRGSAARFFYCAKASRSEREAGLREAESGSVWGGAEDDLSEGKRRVLPAANHHPTVKPIALAEYLARLILPPKREAPRRLLVPFSGSGSEIIGALRAGWDEVVGIELSPEYAEIAEARIAHWIAGQQELAL